MLSIAFALIAATSTGTVSAGGEGAGEAVAPASTKFEGGEEEKGEGAGPSPALAATLAAIYPGFGHYYLGEYENGEWFTLGITGLVVSSFSIDELTESKKLGAKYLRSIGLNLHMYQIYDAYRDARLAVGNAGYTTPIDRHDYTDLLLAPLNPDVMLRWEVAVPLLATATGLIALRLAFSDRGAPINSPNRRDFVFREEVGPWVGFAAGTAANALEYAHVGIGEEALFRGVIQTGLVEWLGPWLGIPLHSVIFSLFHFPNYGGDGPSYIVAMLAGTIFGIQYHLSEDMRFNVATHAWLDFSLTVVDHLLDPENNPVRLQIAVPF